MTEVEYPGMRDTLLYAVRALSDAHFQLETWVELRSPRPGYVYTFDDPFHALLDDVPVADWGEEAIGVVLINDRELVVLVDLTQERLRIIEEFGKRCKLDDVRGSASWQYLVGVAKVATVVLGAPVRFP